METLTISTKNLLEIVNVTPNPQVAMAMAFGVYEQPKLAKYAKLNNNECYLTDFRPLDSEPVKYSYKQEKTTTVYYDQTAYDTQEEAKAHFNDEALKNENESCFSSEYKSDWRRFEIGTGEYTIRTSSCDVQRWIDNSISVELVKTQN